MRQPRRVRISEIVALESRAAVLTEEEGTVSGELDLSLDESGHGLVRYRGTEKWYRIGNLDAEPPCTWVDLAALVSAVQAALGERDFAGNVIPFEAPAAGPDDPVGGSSAPDGGSGGTEDATAPGDAETAPDEGSDANAPAGTETATTPHASQAAAAAGETAAAATPAEAGTAEPGSKGRGAALFAGLKGKGAALFADAKGRGAALFAGAKGKGAVPPADADPARKPAADEQN